MKWHYVMHAVYLPSGQEATRMFEFLTPLQRSHLKRTFWAQRSPASGKKKKLYTVTEVVVRQVREKVEVTKPPCK